MGLPKIIQIPSHHVLANHNALKLRKGAPLKHFSNINFVDVFVTLECIHFHILYCISLYPNVPIGRIINIIKSCKVIEFNPPL